MEIKKDKGLEIVGRPMRIVKPHENTFTIRTLEDKFLEDKKSDSS